jgi:23S rRNA pseudouridine955/2504/2580 synthase
LFYIFFVKKLTVLYENTEILVINKPTGLAVQGGSKIVHSVDSVLAQQTGTKMFPVHRLDKDTAGILVVAKNAATAALWTKLLSSALVKKEYFALTGSISNGKNPVPSPFTLPNGTFYGAIDINEQTKPAVTHYSVEKSALSVAAKTVFSMVRLTLGTGRMHQIRIHLAQSGNPVLADDKYGDFLFNKEIKHTFSVRKLQLAAVRLTVPINGSKRVFEIPLPKHIAEAAGAIFSS